MVQIGWVTILEIFLSGWSVGEINNRANLNLLSWVRAEAELDNTAFCCILPYIWLENSIRTEFSLWMSSIWGMHFCSHFFCNHRNLLFSIVSENSSIGTRSCKWDPLKNVFGVCTVRLKKCNFFTSVISSYTAYMVAKSQISPQRKLRSSWNLKLGFIR